jgi:hypothetical protein
MPRRMARTNRRSHRGPSDPHPAGPAKSLRPPRRPRMAPHLRSASLRRRCPARRQPRRPTRPTSKPSMRARWRTCSPVALVTVRSRGRCPSGVHRKHRNPMLGRPPRRHRPRRHRLQRHRLRQHRLQRHRLRQHRLERHRLQRHPLQRHPLQRHPLQQHRLRRHRLQRHRPRRHRPAPLSSRATRSRRRSPTSAGSRPPFTATSRRPAS